MEKIATSAKRMKKRARINVSDCIESGVDSHGLSVKLRRELLLLDPTREENGTRKKKGSVADRGALVPVQTLCVGSRYRLDSKFGFYSKLVPGTMGTIVGFVYTSDVQACGPPLPGASFEEAVTSPEQPQIPLVLFQADAKFYRGESCLPHLPRVVPLYPTTSYVYLHGVKYIREQLPMSPAMASTVHQAQGTTAEVHVMVPPGGTYHNFARGLFYSALSRGTTLAGLMPLKYRITAAMFTKFKSSIAAIDAEYVRLRALANWRQVNNISSQDELNPFPQGHLDAPALLVVPPHPTAPPNLLPVEKQSPMAPPPPRTKPPLLPLPPPPPPPSPPIKPPNSPSLGVIGLTNWGNSCYINTIIQCFLSLPVFREYCVSGELHAQLDNDGGRLWN